MNESICNGKDSWYAFWFLFEWRIENRYFAISISWPLSLSNSFKLIDPSDILPKYLTVHTAYRANNNYFLSNTALFPILSSVVYHNRHMHLIKPIRENFSCDLSICFQTNLQWHHCRTSKRSYDGNLNSKYYKLLILCLCFFHCNALFVLCLWK